jgi:hypothetical protein
MSLADLFHTLERKYPRYDISYRSEKSYAGKVPDWKNPGMEYNLMHPFCERPNIFRLRLNSVTVHTAWVNSSKKLNFRRFI